MSGFEDVGLAAAAGFGIWIHLLLWWNNNNNLSSEFGRCQKTARLAISATFLGCINSLLFARVIFSQQRRAFVPRQQEGAGHMTLRRRRSISLNATAAQAALICQLFELPARALDPMVETSARHVPPKHAQ